MGMTSFDEEDYFGRKIAANRFFYDASVPAVEAYQSRYDCIVRKSAARKYVACYLQNVRSVFSISCTSELVCPN